MNIANGWISPMIALCANSPFFAGKKTGMQSSRTFQFGIFPRTNIVHNLRNYDEYMEIVNNFKSSGAIEKQRHIWWKIRPHVDFNRVEFRVCDAQPSLRKIEMIVGLLNALVRTIDINEDFNLN